MNRISQFDYKGTEVSIVTRNGFVGYTFEKDGKTFGNKVKLENKTTQHVASVVFLLFLSFIETLEAVEKIK
jgi:hypothetical protein